MKISLMLVVTIAILSGCGNIGNSGTSAGLSNDTTIRSREHYAVYTTLKTSFYPLTSKDSIRNFRKYFTPQQQEVIMAINRIDADNIIKLDTIILPRDITGNVNQYSPFPQELPFLKDIEKMVFFSYPAQYFAAYYYGRLVISGPTNMGRQKDPTPIGLFYANWKAEETTSTVNDEWDLKWNFNIENKEGIGWHQYSLPGYPASHSCLRLLESDAKYLYHWADEWVIKGTDNILAQGTPVLVFGTYPFTGAKPWLQLLKNSSAMNITTEQLEQESSRFLNDIRMQQRKRDQLKGK